MRSTLILATIAALAFATVADAKSCKDAAGKFIKCPSAVAAQTSAKATTVAKTKSAKANEKAAKKDESIAKAASKKAQSDATTAAKDAAKIAPATTTPMAAAATTSGAPHCKKGKPCGHSCIRATDVCHKS